MSPDRVQMPEGGAGVVVTIDEMYRLLVKIDKTVEGLAANDVRILSDLAEHEVRINAHDVVIGKHGERITSLEAWKSDEERSAPPRANGVTIAAVVVAGLSVVVAVIAIIVGSAGA